MRGIENVGRKDRIRNEEWKNSRGNICNGLGLFGGVEECRMPRRALERIGSGEIPMGGARTRETIQIQEDM